MPKQILKNLPTRLAVNLQARKMTIASKQKGASALEYIVLAGAIAVVIAIAAAAFGNDVSGFFDTLLNDLTGTSGT